MAVLEVMGWSLLHSIWQGAVVALLLWAVLQVVRDALPQARYIAGVLALATLLALPVINYRQTMDAWRGHRTWLVQTADEVIRGQLRAGRADPEAVTTELRRRHATIWPGDTGAMAAWAERGQAPVRTFAWLWLAGVVLLGGRLVRDARRARKLAGSGSPAPAWREAARRAAANLGVDRPVRVRATYRVDVPVLVGWRWPVILVPGGDAPGTNSMDAVLAHEIAHVRRHDYLANLLQAVADVLLFYNPAAWWISGRIREERECACDVTAVRAIEGGLTRYIRTLLALETRRAPLAGAAALNGGPLVRRVRRLHARTRDGRAVDWGRAAALVLVAGTLGFAAPERAHPVPLAARVSATSLMLQDLDGMRVVVGTVRLPDTGPTHQPEVCPPEKDVRA